MARRRVYQESAVITKAAELFARHGYRNITMQFLAEELGITKPTLYAYGQSKQGILEAINLQLLEKIEKVVDAMEGQTDVEQSIRFVVEGLIEIYIDEWASVRVNHSDYKEVSPQFKKNMADRTSIVPTTLARLIGQGQVQGIVKVAVPPRFLAWTLLAALNWLPLWYREEGWSKADIAEYLLGMFGFAPRE